KRMDETETPLLDRADDLLERAREACLAAEAPEELDEIGDALYEYRNFEMGHSNTSRNLQRARQRIDGAMRYVEAFQQYLEALSSDNHAQAAQQLNQLAQYN